MSEDELAFLELTARASNAVEEYKLACISALWTQARQYRAMLKAIEEAGNQSTSSTGIDISLIRAKSKLRDLVLHREGLLAEAILALRV
jgi:hypothetical protein